MAKLFCDDIVIRDGLVKGIHFSPLSNDDLPRSPDLTPGTITLATITVGPGGNITAVGPSLAPGTYYSVTVNADGSITWSTTPPSSTGGRLFSHSTTYGSGVFASGPPPDDTVLANTLTKNGDVIRCYFAGGYVGSATATRQIVLSLGGTTILDTGAIVVTADSSWTLQASIMRVDSGNVKASAALLTDNAPLADYTAAVGYALDLTSDQILRIVLTAGGVGAANGDITVTMSYTDYCPS